MIDQHRLETSLRFQRDVLSRAQAFEYGFSESQISDRVAAGHWRRLFRSAYLTNGCAPTFEQRAIAATLSVGGYASHETAAFLHQLDGFDTEPEGPLVVTVRDLCKRRKQPGLRVVQTRELHSRDITVAAEVLVTSDIRTVIDLAPRAPTQALMLAYEHLVRRGRWRKLVERFAELSNGRQGLEVLAQLINRRGPDPTATESAAEAICDHHLLTAGFTAVRQLNVKYRGRRARIDLAFPEFGVAVECDSRWHDNDPKYFADRERDGWLAEYGWTVIRYTWKHLMDERRVVKRLENTISKRAGLPPPSLTD